jgi:exodeoxyribonuclease III
MLEAGWADVFRSKHPDTVAYSYWHLISRARERNVGWRIDAFYLNEQDLQSVKRIRYDTEQMGSDHCPVTIELV